MASDRLAQLRAEINASVRASGGATRAEAKRAAAEGRPEVLRARYRRERLTREARALERAEAAGRKAPTARQALGHGAERVELSAYLAGSGSLPVVVEVDRRDARRIGRHDELLKILARQGNYRGRPLSPERFRAVVRGWRPVRVYGPAGEAGERRLLADPAAALVALELARVEGRESFVYRLVGR